MTNSQLSTTEPKKKENKLSKLKQEQNHRKGYHIEGYQQGGGGRRMGKKVQGIISISGWYKIDRGKLKIVQEMQKPKNLYVQPMDMN